MTGAIRISLRGLRVHGQAHSRGIHLARGWIPEIHAWGSSELMALWRHLAHLFMNMSILEPRWGLRGRVASHLGIVLWLCVMHLLLWHCIRIHLVMRHFVHQVLLRNFAMHHLGCLLSFNVLHRHLLLHLNLMCLRDVCLNPLPIRARHIHELHLRLLHRLRRKHHRDHIPILVHDLHLHRIPLLVKHVGVVLSHLLHLRHNLHHELLLMLWRGLLVCVPRRAGLLLLHSLKRTARWWVSVMPAIRSAARTPVASHLGRKLVGIRAMWHLISGVHIRRWERSLGVSRLIDLRLVSHRGPGRRSPAVRALGVSRLVVYIFVVIHPIGSVCALVEPWH